MDRIATFLVLLVAALVLVPGCFAEEMSTEVEANATAVEEIIVEEVMVEDAANATTEEAVVEEVVAIEPDFMVNATTTTLEIAVNQTVAISLTAEDAGVWNVTMSEGLEQVGNSTVVEATEEWIVKAIEAGTQTFSAVHEATDAEATEAGESYTLELVVA